MYVPFGRSSVDSHRCTHFRPFNIIPKLGFYSIPLFIGADGKLLYGMLPPVWRQMCRHAECIMWPVFRATVEHVIDLTEM